MNVYALKNYASPLSSSGGAFPAIVEAYKCHIKSEDLIIYGAAFVDDFDVKHIRVKYADGLDRLVESKYAQSNINHIFKSVSIDLTNAYHVIFVGTPCQVNAIKEYLQRQGVDDSKLLTIDLICHGTPSNRFWNQYVEYIKRHTDGCIKEIHFRYKHGVQKKKDSLAFVMDGGAVNNKPSELCTYMRLFSRNLSISRGCFNCAYRNEGLIRPGDFTIGDFWGVAEVLPRFRNINGVSLIIAHNKKSHDMILEEMISDHNIIVEECKGNNWLEYNPHLNIQTKMPKEYFAFWNDYHTVEFDKLISKWKKEPLKAKIKIVLSNITDVIGIKYKLKHLINKAKHHKS